MEGINKDHSLDDGNVLGGKHTRVETSDSVGDDEQVRKLGLATFFL